MFTYLSSSNKNLGILLVCFGRGWETMHQGTSWTSTADWTQNNVDGKGSLEVSSKALKAAKTCSLRPSPVKHLSISKHRDYVASLGCCYCDHCGWKISFCRIGVYQEKIALKKQTNKTQQTTNNPTKSQQNWVGKPSHTPFCLEAKRHYMQSLISIFLSLFKLFLNN